MSEKKKYTKVGAVLKGNKPGSSFIVLGNERANQPKYQTFVDMRVCTGDNQVLIETTNPAINVFDPRTRPGITDEERNRIPDNILFELFIIEN